MRDTMYDFVPDLLSPQERIRRYINELRSLCNRAVTFIQLEDGGHAPGNRLCSHARCVRYWRLLQACLLMKYIYDTSVFVITHFDTQYLILVNSVQLLFGSSYVT